MNRNFRINCLIPLLLLLLVAHTAAAAAATTSPDTIRELKMSLNRLVRQQNVQLTGYKRQLESAAVTELRESVFAISEVFFECNSLWRVLQTQYTAAENEGCASGAPNTPTSIAAEATVDFNQCFSEVESNFLSVTTPIEETLSGHWAASTQLNFWLQAQLFGQQRQPGAFPAGATPLDTFDEASAAQMIFNKAVLWDNVGSFELYNGIRAANAGPLTSAGEFGFFCAYNVRNKFFQKLKATEAFLNTNCGGSSSAAAGSRAEAASPPPMGLARDSNGSINNPIGGGGNADGVSSEAIAMSPEAVVVLLKV